MIFCDPPKKFATDFSFINFDVVVYQDSLCGVVASAGCCLGLHTHAGLCLGLDTRAGFVLHVLSGRWQFVSINVALALTYKLIYWSERLACATQN